MIAALSRLLSADERDAVFGDIVETHMGSAQTLRELVGLFVRRTAVPFLAWEPWALFVVLIVPLGLAVSVLSRLVSHESAVYTWMYANNWDWDLLAYRGFWYVLAVTAANILLKFATLACNAWTLGFFLGAVSGASFKVIRALLLVTLLAGEVAGAPFYLSRIWPPMLNASASVSAIDPNAPVSASFVYRAIFPFVLQLLVVMAPALWGMTQGVRIKRYAAPISALVWTAMLASVVMMLIQTPGIAVLFGERTLEWMFQHRPMFSLMRHVAVWPVCYFLVMCSGRMRRHAIVAQ
jgi:hypothetical protein